MCRWAATNNVDGSGNMTASRKGKTGFGWPAVDTGQRLQTEMRKDKKEHG
ncbi:MAG: hypothetical protein K2O13_03195 [Lachnospiraceae bacterium]|nr:hypothetical protein [Lachnospiraceae bacterium]